MTKEQAVILADEINEQIAEKGVLLSLYTSNTYDGAFPLLINTNYIIIMRRHDTMVGDYQLVPLTWLSFKDGKGLDRTLCCG